MNPNQQKGQDAAPPAYSEVYPSAPQDFTNPANIGWQNNVGPQNMVQQPIMQPQVYQQQVYQGLIPNQQMQQPPTIIVYNNQIQLGENPTTLNPCPHCRHPGLTRVEDTNSALTHGMALLFCFFCWLGCIPYMCRCFKNTNHYCSKCDGYIGVYRRDLNNRNY